MSNTLSIAAVTATIRNLLQDAVNADGVLGGSAVTTTPPDKAVSNSGGGGGSGAAPNQLNLFLYHVVHSSAWRNQPMPGQARPGETGRPPLGLNLYYLISAYGQNNDDVYAHRMLGLAMAFLHDHSTLTPAELKTAVAGSDLYAQVERVRITPQPLSIEEMYKLWSVFQTGYRVSAAYEVAVTLIESALPGRAALPVLRVGPLLDGPLVQSGLVFPYPTITRVSPPNGQDGVRLGETLTFDGHDLWETGAAVAVRFEHRSWDAPVDLVAATATATQTTVAIPNVPSGWPAGLYRVSVVVTTGGTARPSNEVAFYLAPRITNIASTPISGGSTTVSLTFDPEAWPEQHASLLIAGRAIAAQAFTAQTDMLDFVVSDAVPGTYYIRLRVDGSDSLLIDYTGPVPAFDPSQQVMLA